MDTSSTTFDPTATSDFRERDITVFKTPKGLSRAVVEKISSIKNEPQWMLERRLTGLQHFMDRPMPAWGADLSTINFDDIIYYWRPSEVKTKNWDDVPPEVRRTYDRLGIPQAEQEYLAGVGAQYESEVVYHSLQKRLAEKGVIFSDIETAMRDCPEFVERYFGTVIPANDNKFAALNTAVWSGGSFIYVPKGVSIELPLQAYFRINAQNMGQFERTLIIADEGSYVHYVEGCLPAGEQISTGQRWVNIESVKPGDRVMDHTGTLRRVRAVMTRNYRGTMVTIKPMSPCNQFQLTDEHPLFVIPRESVRNPRKARHGWKIEVDTQKLSHAEPRWIPAGKIKAGDFLVYPIPKETRDHKTYSIPWMRLLGYYLAEGSTMIHRTLKMPVIQFSFRSIDRESIEEVKRLVHALVGKKTYEVEQKGRHAVNLVVYSQELRGRVLEGCGKGSATKQLNRVIMELPPVRQRHLLETYYRGDGNVCWRGNSELIRCSTASETLARQIQELWARQGIFAQIIFRKGGEDIIRGRKIQRKDQFIVAYTPHKKHSQIRKNKHGFLVPIRKVRRRKYEGRVFNFEVEKTNSYLVRGFAVHNCSAPRYSSGSLHSAAVEIIVKRNARVRYTTIQNWSTNVYNLVTKRAKVYGDARMEWVDGNLGCLTGDTKIFLHNNVKEIKDINPGDVVFALDGEFQLMRKKVIAVKKSGIQKVYKLQTSNHRSICATANHPFLALVHRGRERILQWTPLEYLRRGDLVAATGAIPDCGKSYLLPPTPSAHRIKRPIRTPRVTSPGLLWLIGFYFGDGYYDKSRMYFAVPDTDPARKSVISLIKKLFGVTVYETRGVVIRFAAAQLNRWFRALSIVGLARTKRIPQWIYTLPHNEKRSFIEGYIAADGYKRFNHKNVSITSRNKELLEDTKLLAMTCGMSPLKVSTWTRREKKPLGKEEKEYTHHFLYFGDKECSGPLQFVRITEKEMLHNEMTYDIEVEGAHNFIANGFIVHNSNITMKYPSVVLMEPGAHGEVLSLAFAGKGQHQDAGGKAIHLAPHTTSRIISKSVSQGGGRTSYRGLLKVISSAHHVKSNVRCDALILDPASRSDTYPTMDIQNDDVEIAHEATVSKVGEDQLFYLQSRGLEPAEAEAMIVNGFMEPIVKELPMEYAVEMNRLIQMNMEGSVG